MKFGFRRKERITEELIGTGEHMCTCAALVADFIIDGQPATPLTDILATAREAVEER